ncbi:hypothetical protein LZ31DRAFT_77100 [Colletotrichum somersetense]|nr:hypothetical protein LZ31DRAFT_77100 [Colletotrichum somersetense]
MGRGILRGGGNIFCGLCIRKPGRPASLFFLPFSFFFGRPRLFFGWSKREQKSAERRKKNSSILRHLMAWFIQSPSVGGVKKKNPSFMRRGASGCQCRAALRPLGFPAVRSPRGRVGFLSSIFFSLEYNKME